MTAVKEGFHEIEIQKAINRVLNGNPEDFEIIYDAYHKMVISIIRRIVRPDASELDSIVNEAFLLIYKSLKGFKGDSKFSTYAYRIVLNYAFKVSKKRAKYSKNISIFGENNEIENIASLDQTTDEKIINKEFLDQAIGSLNKEMQEVIDLYYYERYSIKEISEIVNSTETAVKNRLHQARKKIKLMIPEGVTYA